MSTRKKSSESSEPKSLAAAMGQTSKHGYGDSATETPSLLFHNVLKNASSGKAKARKKDPLHVNGSHDSNTRVTIPSAKQMQSKKRTGFHMPKNKG